jgi:ribosome-associated protein
MTRTVREGGKATPAKATRKKTPRLDARVEAIAEFAREKKAEKVVVLDVKESCSFADTFLICSGRSNRQVQAIGFHVEECMKRDRGESVVGSEGYAQGHWVLLDYGDVIVHVFYEPTREFYDLEGLWSHVPRRELDDPR